MQIPKEVLKKVRLIELQSRKVVNSLFAGQYKSAFRGQGMTFSDFREYVPGDDVRAIAWNLTARSGKTYIKKFDEERESTLMLVVDVSGSSVFGTQKYFRGEIMAHLGALLGLSAVKANDPVGLLLFSDRVEHYVPPKKGRGQIHRILRDLLFYKPISKKTKISDALTYLQGVLKKKSQVFIFSDFFDQDYSGPLRMLARKHDVVAVQIRDPMEEKMPNLGLIALEDAETGQAIWVDSSSRGFQNAFREESMRRKAHREAELRSAQVSIIDVATDSDYVKPLIRFFQMRSRR